jgi:hypothetical protein
MFQRSVKGQIGYLNFNCALEMLYYYIPYFDGRGRRSICMEKEESF